MPALWFPQPFSCVHRLSLTMSIHSPSTGTLARKAPHWLDQYCCACGCRKSGKTDGPGHTAPATIRRRGLG